MPSILSPAIGSGKRALIFILLIVVVSIIDSQFINIFYGTNLGSPSNYHLALFISLAIIASIINNTLLMYAKGNDIQATTTRPLLFRFAYIGTSSVRPRNDNTAPVS